jgi:hypothetical protein
MPCPPDVAYVYVLVRRDLPPDDRPVQAAHAVLAHGYRGPEPRVHPHLVLLGLADEAALRAARERLQAAGLATTPYHEPDFGGALTAFALGPVSGPTRRLLGRYPLLKGASDA